MIEHSDWTIFSRGFTPQRQHHEETVFSIGNGMLSTRGAFEEGYPGESHATLIHGVFDDIPIVFTELANAPNWVAMEILVEGEHFSLAQGQVLSFRRELDLRRGLLTRSVRWQSPMGRTLDFVFERFASLPQPHQLWQRLSVTPVNFDGALEVRLSLDGSEDTQGMAHWSWLDQGFTDGYAWLSTQTRTSQIGLGLAMRLALYGAEGELRGAWDLKNHPTLVIGWQVHAGERVRLEKTVSLFTSREAPEPAKLALQELEDMPEATWEGALAAQQAAWEKEWEQCDVQIEGDEEAQISLRYAIYQLLIAAPRHDERVSLGAKTLSGYGYRGHAFWDTEIFMLPFFTFTRPEIARNLLSYRWHNLPGAREKARQNGFKGAQFPWESAASGEEVTPTWVPNPADRTQLIRIWTGDIEIHVSADIAYAIQQYWQASGDDAFMLERGAQVILETARFWASRAEWVPTRKRYEFSDVIGPDEYHDHVDNNAYTNYFARWNLLEALQVVDWLKAHHARRMHELSEQLALGADELENWQHVADGIYIPYDPDTGLLEQFDGYFNREDVDLAAHVGRSESMQQMLGIAGVSLTQVLKQPDVLMLLYLHPQAFADPIVQRNYAYYTPRTDHAYGSSLGPAIQAIMACRVGRPEEAFEQFKRAAQADLYDVRGNSQDGIHGASAGGLWQAVVFGFAGLQVNPAGWSLHPSLPPGWKRVRFKFCYQGKTQEVDVKNQHDPQSLHL